MARLLILIALLTLAWWLWRQFTRAKKPRPPAAKAQPMVRCARCGVHVPQADALAHYNRWYCCRDHLEQDHPPEQR